MLPHRILVVIDDLDRLMSDELLMVFKLIRHLGRLSGVHYLLAYDEQTLLAVLQESQLARHNPNRALAYLEKIVEVRFDLPMVHPVQVDNMIQHCVDDLFPKGSKLISKQEREELMRLLKGRLRVRLNEPRSIKRFFAQIAAYLPLVMNRVYMPDFIVLTYFRTFYPLLYRELHRLKKELVATRHATELTGSFYNWRVLVEKAGVPEVEFDNSQELIAEVFPSVRRFPTEGDKSIKRRAASRHYFHRYFQFDVPPDDGSKEQLEEVFDRLRGPDAKESLERLGSWLEEDLDRILPMLGEMLSNLDALQRAYLLVALMDRLKEDDEHDKELRYHDEFIPFVNKVGEGFSGSEIESVRQRFKDESAEVGA